MTQEATLERVEQQECVHHWIISTADGPTSQGTCKRCGMKKEFYNYIENGSWGDDEGPTVRDSARAAIKSVVPQDPGDGDP